MSLEVFPTEGKPAHQLRTLSWTATAGSGGADGALALDFSSVKGSASTEGNGNCYDGTATLSLAAAKNPVAGGWFLNETNNFPNAGWKYSVLGVPTTVPVLTAETGKCSSVQTEELLQPNEMLLTQETFSPPQLAEYEATMDPLEFTPGTPATRTRSFSFDGISHCRCLPHETHVKESITLTVSATSPAAGNDVKTEPAPSSGGPGPRGGRPAKKRSKAHLKALKEQAQEKLGPDLEAAWSARGIFLAPGLTAGVALSTVLDELGQDAARVESESATARVINDYRIINDPPDHHFHQLAKPRPFKRPVLPSCGAATSAERKVCADLRAAETAMLTSSARAGVISDALLTTVNRDSTALRAADYASAEHQYAHFLSLNGELRRVLKRRGISGARVAAILRGLGVTGVLSAAQSGAAISGVEAVLTRAHVPLAKLGLLAGSALQAREANALLSLASQRG